MADDPYMATRRWTREIAVHPVEPLENRLFLSAGATVPYTTYEAENSTYTGTLIGPSYAQNTVAGEASGREAVQLNAVGQYVQINAAVAANSLVVRYSIPDSSDGTGINSTLSLYINGSFVQKLAVTSEYSWQYGAYPFSNTPSQGLPRNFYDEVRSSGLTIPAGATVRVERDSTDTAASYDTIDLIDLENVGPAITQPANSINVTAAPYNAVPDGTTNDTIAIQTAVNAAMTQHKTVWVPAGNYKLVGFITGLNGVTIQGAGMWYTHFVGDPSLYNTSDTDRVGFVGAGSNIHLNDFSITGDLNYRDDSEANDGIGGSFGSGSSINDLWIEHTKVGMWLINSSGLTISNCRVRDTIADGINLSVGMQGTIVSNCTVRGTGDDCFAIYPATYTSQTYAPGNNQILNCTGIEPYLANGGAIYGAAGNTINNCLFEDINDGAGVLISTTFDVGTNTFSGSTTVENSTLLLDGGSTTFGAVQFTADLNPITGVALSNLTMTSNAYSGLGVHDAEAISNSTATGLTIGNTGLSGSSSYGVYVESIATGGLAITNSTIGDYNQAAPNFNLSLSGVTGPLPSPWIAGDINLGVKGSTSFSNGTFTVAGSGSGIRSSIDGFRFVSQNVNGDQTLAADVASLQNTGTSPMAGLMFRNDTTTSPMYAGVFVTPTTGVSFQYRATAGGSIKTTTVTGIAAPVHLQLTRAGNSFSGFYSTDGVTWHQIGATTTVAMVTTVMTGMAVSAANKAMTATATFSGVSVIQTSINVAAGTTTTITASPSGPAVLVAAGLTLAGTSGAWTGKLDITNNIADIIGGSLATITNQVEQGYDRGTWLGEGITSGTAAADSTHLTAIGVIQNNQAGTAIYNSSNLLDGTAPGASDILVKYTYYGDTNFDGKVDGSDYSRIDNGFLTHATGWFNGDFNYDGVVNGSDYTLIDNAFNTQGASLAAKLAGVVNPPTRAASAPASKSRTQLAVYVPNVFKTGAPIAFAYAPNQSIEISMRKKDVLDALTFTQ